MKRLSGWVLLALLVSGCNREIADFVRDGERRAETPVQQPSSDHPLGLKISPGANLAAGNSVQSRFALTPSQRTVQGGQVKSKFSFHANRPN